MQEPNQADEIDLFELLLTLAAEWRLILAATASILAISLTYAFLIAPKRYEATAVLSGVERVFCPPGIGSCEVPLPTALSRAAQLALLPAGIEALDTELGLISDPEFEPKRGEATAFSVMQEVTKAVDLKVDGASLWVTVRHRDEGRAIALANGFLVFIRQEL